MRFIDPTSGADVDNAHIGTHLFRRVRFEDDSLLDKCLAAQPEASWEFIGGVRTLEYSEAALWAAAAAFGADNLGGEMQYYLRPTPAKMEETLNAALWHQCRPSLRRRLSASG